MNFDVIILDFDGVIVESNGIKHQAMADLFRPYTEKYDEIMEYHHGHNAVNRHVKFRHIQENIFEQTFDKSLAEQWADTFSSATRKAIIACDMVKGAKDFLEYFHGKVPMYIASATPADELAVILQERGFLKYIKAHYGAPTPKIEMFGLIARDEGVAKEQILFIGDSAEDEKAAKAFGCQFLARQSEHNFTSGQSPVFPDLEKMLTMLVAQEISSQ